MNEPSRRSYVSEYQIVRLDGTVLYMVAVPHGEWFWYSPHSPIMCPVIKRARELFPGDPGPWVILGYYPDGYPGPTGPWHDLIEAVPG